MYNIHVCVFYIYSYVFALKFYALLSHITPPVDSSLHQKRTTAARSNPFPMNIPHSMLS